MLMATRDAKFDQEAQQLLLQLNEAGVQLEATNTYQIRMRGDVNNVTDRGRHEISRLKPYLIRRIWLDKRGEMPQA